MAIIEQSAFNNESFQSFVPNVTKERNANLLSSLFIAGITVVVGLIVYYEVTKHMETRRKNLASAVNEP